MLIWDDIAAEVPAFVPVLWLVASLAGAIAPCVLVRLKMFKSAAVSSVVGAIALVIVHFSLSHYVVNAQFVWFYLPLLAATAAVLTMLIVEWRENVAQSHNAPAPSILGKLEEINDHPAATRHPSKEGNSKGGKSNGTIRPESTVSHSRKRKRKRSR